MMMVTLLLHLLLSLAPSSTTLRAASAAPFTAAITSSTGGSIADSDGGPRSLQAMDQDTKCPLTSLPPHRPSATVARCPEASELSCCTDCFDYQTITDLVTSNSMDLVNKVDWTGGISSLLGGTSFNVGLGEGEMQNQ